MSKIYNNIGELVGNTPIMRLVRTERELSLGSGIFAKLEYLNPTGSIKDRAAKEMLNAALQSGAITENSVIIEPTSGNTGIGIAAIAASRGYRAIIVMPDTMSRERQLFMMAYGAEVVLTDGALGMKGSIEKALELKESIDGAFIPSQFENIENKYAHIRHTGPEIYDAMDGDIDYLVATVGTGGTISGVGEFLKSKNPDVRIIAIEPEESPLISKGYSAPHKIQGIGANFIPDILNLDIIDEVITVNAQDAYATVRKIGALEGLGIGISSGAALAGAIRIAEREDRKRIAVILPDGIDRYLSTDIFD